jgi:uncharacterized repeat protein (TIGR03803 family)
MRKLSLSGITCIIVFCAVTAIVTPAQTFTTLLNFNGKDGAQPAYMALIQGSDKNFYGTTVYGGTHGRRNRDGTVFTITSSGTLTRLHSFHGTDGTNPFGALLQATDGNFYGTTCCAGAGFGTVFKMSPSGQVRTLYKFHNGADGGNSNAGLLQATDGTLYGTTVNGGTGKCSDGCGVIFKITIGGKRTTFHTFEGSDGWRPYGLIQATDKNIYGITSSGGANGYGTVFTINTAGTFTSLYSFCAQANCSDGANPMGTLAQASDGTFYGTTTGGGTNGYGTVFTITAEGVFTTLYSFDGTDGMTPIAGLIQGSDENFYGTTSAGGANGQGTIFSITPAGTLTTLHSFNGTDGANSNGALVQGTDGKFYGATQLGGTHKQGTLFSLSVGLGPSKLSRHSTK